MIFVCCEEVLLSPGQVDKQYQAAPVSVRPDFRCRADDCRRELARNGMAHV